MSSPLSEPLVLKARAALRRTVMSRPKAVGLALFALALIARLALVLTSRFTGDEIHFWDAAHKVATGAEFPLLGPIITNGPARHPGPLLFDLIAIPLFFSSAPEAANVFVALLGALSVVLYWEALRPYFGEWGALLAGFMMACSPWSTLYADRIWNPNVIGIFVALAFYAACSLRRRPTLGMVALLCFSMAAMPQLHMSSPMVWVALMPIWLPSVRKWRWHWPLVALLCAATLYIPYVVHELGTNWSNTRAFLNDHGGGPSTEDWKRVPAWAFRLLTLDVSYHQLHSYWGPHTEDQMIEFLKRGNSDFQFNFIRRILLALSFLFALFVLGLAVVRARTREFWKLPHPFFWAALIGVLANTALLGVMHKEVFGHYVQSLIPFYFVAFAAAGEWAEENRHAALVWGAATLVSIGGLDAALWVSETMDARNGLLTMRRVLAAIEADDPGASRAAISFAYRGGARGGVEGFNVIASLDPNRKLRLDYGNQYLMTFKDDPQPPSGKRLLETGPIILYKTR